MLNKTNFCLVNNNLQLDKNYNIIIDNTLLKYVGVHMKFSSMFYSLQLVDIFAYETLALSPNTLSSTNQTPPATSIIIYNFHSLFSNERFFIHTYTSNCESLLINSITELFFSANWLEREVSELHGISFSNKKDIRNLMLQYGDSSFPFKKLFPTIGLKEMYYEPVKDTLIQNPVTIQL